jgi:hypothetical protein
VKALWEIYKTKYSVDNTDRPSTTFFVEFDAFDTFMKSHGFYDIINFGDEYQRCYIDLFTEIEKPLE